MQRLRPHIYSETGRLRTVLIGIADHLGEIPRIEDCYDPKSRESVINGVYPKENDLIAEINSFASILKRYDVKVFRPEDIHGLNQVFARDISFAIEDYFIIPNIIEDREEEIEGVAYLRDIIEEERTIEFVDNVHAEGGDCMPWKDHLFVGYSPDPEFDEFRTSRTNDLAVKQLAELFPHKTVYPIELVKSDVDPRQGVLHLDCCFQPIGTDEAILYPAGMKHQRDVDYITSLFGKENLIEVDQGEFYNMFPNIFSIDPKTIVSNSSFERLNQELERRGYHIEAIKYDEISKMGGLLRCSSMPLFRERL
jgi:N-dimethylarginine dimethylaminohydrolase